MTRKDIISSIAFVRFCEGKYNMKECWRVLSPHYVCISDMGHSLREFIAIYSLQNELIFKPLDVNLDKLEHQLLTQD